MEGSNHFSTLTEESKYPIYDKYKNLNPIKIYNIGAHKIEIEERYKIKQSSIKTLYDNI